MKLITHKKSTLKSMLAVAGVITCNISYEHVIGHETNNGGEINVLASIKIWKAYCNNVFL
jgi:hypothetical protein